MTPTPRAERLAVVGLLAAMTVSAVALLVLSDPLTFWADELDWLTAFEGWGGETLLTPHNGHLIATIRILYEGLPDLFDASYLPFRVVSVAAVLASAGAFFVLARRRIGGPLALAPTVVLLFFGSSSEVVVSPVGLPISLSIAFGLWALALIDRDDARPGVGAAFLLLLAVATDTFGVIIALGAAILLALDPARRRRLWVAVVPIVLYAIWWIWARKFDQDIASSDNIAGVPLFVLESAAAAIGAITGIGKSFGSGSDSVETVTGIALAAIALAAAALLILRARRTGAGPALWAFGLTLLGFWVSVGLSESEVRQPTTPRYLFFAGLMVFLVFAEAYRRGRPTRGATLAVVGFLGLCLVGNAIRLVSNSDGLADRAEVVSSQLGMIDLAGADANPGFRPVFATPVGSTDIVAPAGALVAFGAEHGPLGMPVSEVEELPPGLRADADFILARALDLAVAPVPESAASLGSCRDEGAEGESVRVPLLPGATILRVRSDGTQPLLVGRFGDAASVEVGELGPEPVAIGLGEDAASESRPWFLEATGALEICETGAAG